MKLERVFGFPANHFSTSLLGGAYYGPPIVRFAKADGDLDTAWVTAEWHWDEVYALDRWFVQAASMHTSGAVIVSMGQSDGMLSAGSLLLLDPTDCTLLHAIDSLVAAPGFESGVAVDVKTFPNGGVAIVHQDAASGNAWTFRDSGLDVFDPIAKQGSMFHILNIVDGKFVVDTGFTAAALWEFQVGGQDKYGLADLPIRLCNELLFTSPIIATIPFPGGDDDYFGKWGVNAPGEQIGMVFWHGDPYDPTRCWDTHNGTYSGATWTVNGLYAEACSLGETWNDTVAAYPLAVLGSALESMDDGDLESGVGVYVCGPVAKFKNTSLKSLCNLQTLSIDGGSINQADFQYYPFLKLTALGALDTAFVQHLYEYQEADADQLAGLEFGVDVRRYCGRVLCAAVFAGEFAESPAAKLIPNPPNWGRPVEWQRRWQTAVADTLRVKEAREALRVAPPRSLSFTTTLLDIDERNECEERVRAVLKTGAAAIPYWGRSSVLTAAASPASNTLTVAPSAWPWTVGDWVFLKDSLRQWELVQLTETDGNNLTFGETLARTYPAGSRIWPLLYGKLTSRDLLAHDGHRCDLGLSLADTDPATVRPETSCPVVATYLGRPIFPFAFNWSGEVVKRFEFDLRELVIGFGRASFAPTQSHIAQGFEFNLTLNGDAAIKAMDCFTEALRGRLTGFWLPGPADGMQLLELGVSGDRFYIRATGLAEAWTLHPDQYLALTQNNATYACAKIQSVTDLGDGRELVVMDAPLSFTLSYRVMRLHYVRFAEDEERALFVDENRQVRHLRVVELPHEYASAETGLSPVFLYRFWLDVPGGTQSWFFTSWGVDFTSNSQLYTAKPITHGEIRRSTRSDREEVRIEANRESDHPLALLWPFRLALPLWVEIKETTLAAPDTAATVFLGQVDRAPVNGRKITASCASLLDALGAQAMRFLIGPKCNHKVYSPACGVSHAAFEVTVAIASLSVDRLTVRVTGAALNGKPANWFADGWIQTGTGAAFQYATILESNVIDSTTHELVLNWPLHSATLTDVAKVVTGCDGKFGTCGTKFSNQINFGGHPRVPIDNPALPTVPVESGGGKK